jgi:glycosyltransferase involved in cell wall biosynthesis
MAERRILLLVTDLEIGGTPTVVRELATRLHDPEKGVHVEVACLSKWGPVADQIRDAGVEVTALNAWGVRDLVVVRRLVRLVHRHQVDTVLSFLIHANAVAAAIGPFCRGVRFLQSIQTTQPAPRWHWRLQRLVHRAAETVVVPTESVAEAAATWSAIPRQKVVLIPNAIDPDAFARSAVPLSHPRPYPVGFIGRLDRIKRVEVLLNNMFVLRTTAPGLVHLHVYGDGPERAFLQSRIRDMNLDAVVTMHGPIPRPQDALTGLGMLVLPSLAEGFGLVLIEAMAAGVPVVATNTLGIRDVVRPDETGLLVQVDSPLEIAVAIRRLIEDDDLRARLIRNGLAEVRERFSWAAILPSYRRLLGID